MQNGDIFSFQLLNIVKTMCKQQHSLQRSWQKYNKIAWTVILLHLLHFAWQECKSNIHILLWFLLRHHMKNWATDINKSGTVEEWFATAASQCRGGGIESGPGLPLWSLHIFSFVMRHDSLWNWNQPWDYSEAPELHCSVSKMLQ